VYAKVQQIICCHTHIHRIFSHFSSWGEAQDSSPFPCQSPSDKYTPTPGRRPNNSPVIINNLDSLPIFVRISYRQAKNKDNNCQNSPIIETFFDRLRRQLYCVQPDNYNYHTRPDRFPKPGRHTSRHCTATAKTPVLSKKPPPAGPARRPHIRGRAAAHTRGALSRIHDQPVSQ
jgi:hypothetical protein